MMSKNVDVTKAKETETVIVFKANRRLDEVEFELMSKMVERENKKDGVSIVLMPFSCDLGELDG